MESSDTESVAAFFIIFYSTQCLSGSALFDFLLAQHGGAASGALKIIIGHMTGK